MKKKLTLTGGLGHIGSSILRDNRINQFDEIYVLDNMSSQKHCSLFSLQNNITFRELDIVNSHQNDLEEFIKGSHTVIHLAAIVNAITTFDESPLTEDVNFKGACRIVDIAKKYKVNTFVYPSTCSVYGPKKGIRYENEKDLRPQTPYAKTKLQAEKYILSKNISNIYTPRFGTVFGYSVGIRTHTAINKFVWDAITENPITIWKPGTGKRPYVSLYAVKESIFNLIKLTPENGIYNIVSEHWSPNDIVKFIREVKPFTKVDYITPRILNQDSYIINFDKALNKNLYKQSKSSAEEDLREYINMMVTIIMSKVNRKEN